MNKTVFKPFLEIEAILAPYHRIAILSCGTCAMLSGAGGTAGIRQLQAWLKDRNKKTTLARCVAARCPEEIMRQSLRIYGRFILQSGAQVVLACAAGVKSAFFSRPPIPRCLRFSIRWAAPSFPARRTRLRRASARSAVTVC